MKKTRKSGQASSVSQQLSLLPEPDFNPKIPEKNTNLYHAVHLLLKGKRIYHRDFDKKTDSYRLAAYILELKKMGWPILDFWVAKRVSKKPKIRRYKRYFIKKHIIANFFKNGGVL
jgi:Helix-turn-helix domain